MSELHAPRAAPRQRLDQRAEARLRIAGAVHEFGPDTTLAIPANIVHQFVNTSTEPIRLMAVLSASPVVVLQPDGTAASAALADMIGHALPVVWQSLIKHNREGWRRRPKLYLKDRRAAA